jgi:HEPN domain-containing protein
METSEPATYRIEAVTGQLLISPLGTMRRAREFFDASEFLRQQADRFSPVSGFLACRAVELSLKAFLRVCGVEWSDVRAFGHDIARLLVETHIYGIDDFLTLSPEDRGLLIGVSNDYLEQRWAYFDIEWAFMSGVAPDPVVLAALVGRIVASLESVCERVAMGGGSPPTVIP